MAEDDDAELPDKVQRQIDRASPYSIRMYMLYKHDMYCAEVKASDLAKKLVNGATYHLDQQLVRVIIGPLYQQIRCAFYRHRLVHKGHVLHRCDAQ